MAQKGRKKELLDRLLREEIAEVVLTMIKEDQALSMEEVARRCGVAKGTLYNYFANKDDLLDHVHQVFIQPLIESNQTILNGEGGALQRLHCFIEKVYQVHEEISVYMRFVWRQRSAEHIFNERFELAIHPLADLCRHGSQAGELIPAEPYVMAELIFGAVIGPLNSLAYREDAAYDLDAMKRDVHVLIDRLAV